MAQWTIDTGMTGEVDAKDLKATLLANKKHFLDTQAEAAALRASAAAGKAPEGPAEAMAHMQKVAAQADAMKQAYLLSMSPVMAHMDYGIEAACKLAEMFDGKVTASIQGHDDDRHRSGCDKRVSIMVDQTYPGDG